MTTKSKVILFGLVGALVLTAGGVSLASAYGGGYGYGMRGSGYGYNQGYGRAGGDADVQSGNNYGGGWEMGPQMMRGYDGGYGCW